MNLTSHWVKYIYLQHIIVVFFFIIPFQGTISTHLSSFKKQYINILYFQCFKKCYMTNLCFFHYLFPDVLYKNYLSYTKRQMRCYFFKSIFLHKANTCSFFQWSILKSNLLIYHEICHTIFFVCRYQVVFQDQNKA